jgi:hypothetical protein
VDIFFPFGFDFAGNIVNIAKKSETNGEKIDQNGAENRMSTEPWFC